MTVERDALGFDAPAKFEAAGIKLYTISYDDQACMLPRTETIVLDVPLDVIDIPKIGLHTGHGQREGEYDGSSHFRRLLLRKIKRHPLGFVRFIGKSIRPEIAARVRRLR